MKLKVKYAKLHTEYFSNGTGNMGVTLEPAKHTGLTMFLTEQGLFCTYKGVHFLVSSGNLVGVTFFEDPFKEPAAAQVAA